MNDESDIAYQVGVLIKMMNNLPIEYSNLFKSQLANVLSSYNVCVMNLVGHIKELAGHATDIKLQYELLRFDRDILQRELKDIRDE